MGVLLFHSVLDFDSHHAVKCDSKLIKCARVKRDKCYQAQFRVHMKEV